MTALILVGAVTVVILWLPSWAVAGVVGMFWLWGAWEWAGFAQLTSIPRLAYGSVVAGLMLALARWGFDGGAAQWILVIALLWWALALVWIQTYPRHIPRLLIGAAGLLALLPSWFTLTYVHGQGVPGPGLALSVLGIVWAADIGAYAVGRTVGRVKLAPQLSPGKTWEGVLGGLASAGLAALAGALVLGLPAGTFLLIGLAAALASIVGDLTVSMFKRHAGVKDSGRILPGHGGVLDRIDSLTAAVPVFALGLRAAGLMG